jgi:hypothetical protein
VQVHRKARTSEGVIFLAGYLAHRWRSVILWR